MALIDFRELDKNKVIDEENIIIGSGAGGSTMSYELLKKNKKSIVLEEGPNIDNFPTKNIGTSIVSLYKNNGATPLYSINGGPVIGYGQGSCVGGSTYVNAGYFSNTPEVIFNKWIKEGRTILKYDQFSKLLNEIRSELMVNTENLSDKDHVSKFLLEKSHALKWKIEKCERFSTGETGKKKQSMNYSYHKELLKQNIDIIYNCKVEKIISNNGVAEYLEAFDKNKKKKLIFKFKNLFLNCGPINTPHLLIKNNILKLNSQNKNFEFHINFKVLVKFKKSINYNFNDKFDPDRPVSIYFMRQFENEGVLLSTANSELPYMLATCSHFDDNLKKDIFINPHNYGMFIYQIKSHSRGVIKNFFNNPVVQYDYNTKDNIQIKKAIERLSQFFLDREVEFILFPVENSFPVKNLKDAKHLSDRFNQKKLHLVSVHGMSSMRPDQLSSSLTDYYGKLKGFKNIFISDASILPGNTGESPQASIMAYTKFIANNIKL